MALERRLSLARESSLARRLVALTVVLQITKSRMHEGRNKERTLSLTSRVFGIWEHPYFFFHCSELWPAGQSISRSLSKKKE